MEKILIVGCKQAMDDGCIGCSGRMGGFIEGTHPYKPDAIFARVRQGERQEV